MAARPHVIDGRQFANHAARRTVPARALARKPFVYIRQGRFYHFAFADDLTGPSELRHGMLTARRRSSALASKAQKLPNCRTSSSSRRSVDVAKSDHQSSDEGRRWRGPRIRWEPCVHWSNAMRSFWALGLLITLCASASAATMHHSRHVIVRSSQGYAVPGWTYAAPQPLIHYDDTPSYDDPSKFGGGTALPVR
jgi:hypothetical protein